MKKLFFILTVLTVCLASLNWTVVKPEPAIIFTERSIQGAGIEANMACEKLQTLGITFDVVKNSDGTYTTSWAGNTDSRVHTVLVWFHYGKKQVAGNLSYGIYSWAHWNPYNGQVELSGSRTFNLFAYDPNAQWVTVHAYICQFTGPESDQYECFTSESIQIKK